ncbi:MAG: hypothetical protein H7A20_12210 [Rhodanobacteraceae bacterium]|nr:hypothetical protein [Rhodanobacteraceae bacterium]
MPVASRAERPIAADLPSLLLEQVRFMASERPAAIRRFASIQITAVVATRRCRIDCATRTNIPDLPIIALMGPHHTASH